MLLPMSDRNEFHQAIDLVSSNQTQSIVHFNRTWIGTTLPFSCRCKIKTTHDDFRWSRRNLWVSLPLDHSRQQDSLFMEQLKFGTSRLDDGELGLHFYRIIPVTTIIHPTMQGLWPVCMEWRCTSWQFLQAITCLRMMNGNGGNLNWRMGLQVILILHGEANNKRDDQAPKEIGRIPLHWIANAGYRDGGPY